MTQKTNVGKPATKTPAPRHTGQQSHAAEIDARLQELSDWRGETLARIRALIKQAAPDVSEEMKWKKASNPEGVPVWSHGGILCTGEIYKNHIKLTFPKGAALKDPSRLFNSGLEGNARRAINIHEGDKLDEEAKRRALGKPSPSDGEGD